MRDSRTRWLTRLVGNRHGATVRAILVVAAIAIGAANLAFAQGTDPAVVGQWSSTFTLPVVPIFTSQLTTGQLMFYDSATDLGSPPQLFFPATLTSESVPYQESPNLFCSEPTPLTDGRIFVVGGHTNGYVGTNNATIFDPALNAWTNVAPMTYGRWYPSTIRLSDGRMLVVSGAIDCSDCTSPTASHLGIADLPEIFDPRDGTWTTISTASLRLPLYPHLYLLPDGRVFAAASQEDPMVSQVLNLSTGTWAAVDSAHKLDGGSSVMYRSGKIMKSGSARNPDYPVTSATKNTYVIDMTAGTPSWRQTAAMANARTQHTLVLLPDGTVLAIGGERNSDVNDLASAVLAAEVWDPDPTAETWRTLSSGQVPRIYHSVAILLPDGRVFVGGGGHPPGFGVAQFEAEIFSPPYLFNGARPTIASAPTVMSYGQSYFLQTPDAAGATSVALIAQGTVTHAYNSNQRYLSLSMTQTPGGLTITAPANANLAPPGYYMMFLVNGSGVPSVASWVRLPAAWEDAQAPTAPASLVANASTGAVGLSWSAATDNVGVTGYDLYRSTSTGFTPTAANRIAQSVQTSYLDMGMNSGTYYYLVRARDAFGNLSPSSNEAFATVVADTTAPGTVAGLGAMYVAAGQLGLAWNAATDNVGVTGYRVERCTGAACSTFAEIGQSTNAAFGDVGLAASTTYRYRVRAGDARGNLGGYSAIVSPTTSAVSGGLVAAWGFDETAGATAVDNSGFVNSGSLGGVARTAQGKFGGALSFDGFASQVTVPDSASLGLTAGMTVEAWVKPSVAATSWKAVLHKNTDRYYLMASSDSGGVPAIGGTFVGGNTNAYGPQPLTVGAWTHLAGTFDGTRMRLFVNGAEVVNVAGAGALTTSAEPLQIGADVYGESFQGVLDEIRIYDHALSASQILADMNQPVGGSIVLLGVRREPVTGALTISWTDSAQAGTYRVRRATGPTPADFANASCFVVQGTTFTDPAPPGNGVSYDFLVDAGSSCP